MSQGPTITIRCPRCHHPYPMTPTQVSVYVGRKMGCVACGKPFDVQPPPEPDPLAAVPGAAGGVPSVPTEEPAVAPGAYGVGQYGATAYGTGAPPAGWPTATAMAAWTSSAGIPPATAPSPPTWLDRAAVAAGVAFLALVAVAAIVGYAGSTAGEAATASSGVAPRALLRVAIGCAAAAVLMGAARLWQTRRRPTEPGDAPRRRDRGHATAAVGLGAAELLAVAVLVLVVWPPMARALGESHKATCQENLQQLGTLLLSEATARRDGKFPDSLTALVGEGKLSPAADACPAAEDAVASTSADPASTAAGQGGSYVYLGRGLATKSVGGTRVGTHTVLAYERPGHHGTAGGLHVLFADGTVVFVEKDEATALLAELTAGKNPPPSAGLVRK